MVFAVFRGKHLRCDEVFICVIAREDSAQSTAVVLPAGVCLAKKPSNTLFWQTFKTYGCTDKNLLLLTAAAYNG